MQAQRVHTNSPIDMDRPCRCRAAAFPPMQLGRWALKLMTAALCALASTVSIASSYPERPLRMYVGYPAGGGMDSVARALAERLTESMGQPVVVDNRPGATGTIAADAAAKSAPDGHTFLFAETGLLIAQSAMPSLQLRVDRDFTPVAGVAKLPLAIGVHPSLPVETTQELIDLLKTNPNKYSYGSAGIGTVHHFVFELFSKEAGIEAIHVPYKGGTTMLPDLIEGRIELGVLSSSIVAPHVATGRIRVLGVSTAEPVSNLPGVPSLATTLPGLDAPANIFILAPANTPQDITTRLHQAVDEAVQHPDFVKVLETQGAYPARATSAELGKLIQVEGQQWAEVAKAAGLQAN